MGPFPSTSALISISQVCKLTVKLGSGIENIRMTLTSSSCRLENPAQVVGPLEMMESLILEKRLILTSIQEVTLQMGGEMGEPRGRERSRWTLQSQEMTE